MLKHVFPYDARAFSFNFLKSNSRRSLLCNCLKNARAVLLSHVRSLFHCSTLRCTNVSLLALRVGRLITKIAARLGVFVVRSLCVCVLTFYVHTSVYGCMYVHNHYTLMQGSKTVPPTYKRRGRGRARWRTGSAKCVRQHKEKN